MQRWSADELRLQFLRFFEEKGHTRLPSASLVPHGDPTLLLTSAGMVPFKPYFLGQAVPEHKRVTTYQRCVRTPDIDEVGYTTRHNTFFEMLGNFSFGDYFKREAIRWAWEFVIERLHVPAELVWATIYEDDDEAAELWLEETGVPKERIVRLGKEDNFWEIGVGPCGPCSEIYIDRGEERGCGDETCAPGCERCERYLEIWNLVFIQYHKDEQGKYTPLDRPGIDTGMGLERVAAVLQGVASNFDIDLVRPIRDAVAGTAKVVYGHDDNTDISLRVITDHIRSVTFLIYDGVLPGNEGRGYVLRRLLRRAARHGHQLGIEGPFLGHMSATVIEQMKVGYPELEERAQFIRTIIEREEERFGQTLEQGMALLKELMDQLSTGDTTVVPGVDVFRLHDTYGFPPELSQEIAAERGFSVDMEGFEEAMEEQRRRARAARGDSAYTVDGGGGPSIAADLAPTEFVGYNNLEARTRVVALFVDGEAVTHVPVGAVVDVVTESTPFYAEGGGQIGDAGTLKSNGGTVDVQTTWRTENDVIVHRGQVTAGQIEVDAIVDAIVPAAVRRETERHHTATHLLHAALHDVLGDHATQAGSLVEPERLRFDFNHFEPLTTEQLQSVERIVNEKIMADLPVTCIETDLQTARDQGAQALFGEKYDDNVRVVRIGDYSLELCGGTHVSATGAIGPFVIASEGSVAAGVRRIEALAGSAALRYTAQQRTLLRDLAEKLHVTPNRTMEQLDATLAEMRALERERDSLKQQLLLVQADTLLEHVEPIGDVPVLTAVVPGVTADDLLVLGDALRERLAGAVIVLASAEAGKVGLLALVAPELVKGRVHAGDIVRAAAQVAGGGGGGQPHMARAGGKRPDKLDEALAVARDVARQQLQAVQSGG